MSNSKPFSGDIEEVTIWSHMMTNKEIYAIYHAPSPSDKLVQGWLFDE